MKVLGYLAKNAKGELITGKVHKNKRLAKSAESRNRKEEQSKLLESCFNVLAKKSSYSKKIS